MVSKAVVAVGLIAFLAVGFLAGLMSAPFLSPQGSSVDPIWDSIVASGKIRVGTEPTWAPYESLDGSGRVVGFEVDLVEAVAARLGLTAEWESTTFGSLVDSVQARAYDLGVSGISITPERLEQVAFTLPHSVAQKQVLMSQDRRDALGITTVTSLADLKDRGLTVGTQTGATQQAELTQANITTILFSDYGAAIDDMMSSNPTIDAVYTETPTVALINTYQQQGKTVAVIYESAYYPCGFIVNKDAPVFLQKIDAALTEIIASGQMDALKAKWGL